MTVINTNIKSLIAQDTLTKNTQKVGNCNGEALYREAD